MLVSPGSIPQALLGLGLRFMSMGCNMGGVLTKETEKVKCSRLLPLNEPEKSKGSHPIG